MIIDELMQKNLLSPPKWLAPNTQFLAYTGSVAYGVNNDTSDLDIHGFCIPHREVVFPHLAGNIEGFGIQKERFRSWQQHHIKNPENNKEYDFTVYNIVDFFQLAYQNNPNVLELLFLPRRCIIHSTPIAEHVRENRKLFLSTHVMTKYRGYSYSQLSKIKNKKNSANPKRAETIEKFGYDVKHAVHCIRLLLQCEQIMVEGDLDVERNSEILKSIRRGEWPLEQVESWFATKEKALETIHANSSLPYSPDEDKLKKLLINCLEMHYGDLSTTVAVQPELKSLVQDLQSLIDQYQPR